MDSQQLEEMRQIFKKNLGKIREAKSKYNRSKSNYKKRVLNSSLRDLTSSGVFNID